jgi:hypothetical protein
MIDTFTFTIVVVALVFNILNFVLLRKKKDGSEGDWCCRYPDTNVRDIIIDYELEKAKKLDDAIHKIEEKND